MNIRKYLAATAMVALVAPSAMAAVRPSVANVTVAPTQMVAGARVGVPMKGAHQKLAGAAVPLAILALAGAGAGIAAGAGAFDGSNHTSTPVSP